jgi:hypothetical protein
MLNSDGLKDVYDEESVKFNPPIGLSDHLTLFITPSSTKRNACNVHANGATRGSSDGNICWHTVYDLRKSNIDFLYYHAGLIDWGSFLNAADNVNDMWSTFHNIMSSLLQSCIPSRLVAISKHDKEWMTPITKALIQDKWSAFRARNWPKYKHLKEKVKLEVQHAKQIWAEKLMKTTNGLWKLAAKQYKNKTTDLSSLGSEEDLLKKISSELNQYFTQHDQDSDFDVNALTDDNWRLTISDYQVRRKLSRYPKTKAPGADGIPTKVYVSLATLLAQPLARIYNKSCAERKFPDAWKKALMVPVPKTNPPHINKLRYISLLPVPSKIMESLVLENMQMHFEVAYGREQHGFRKNASTTTALLSLYDNATKLFDDPKISGLALLSFDLSSAFDFVDHNLSLHKMFDLNFPIGFLKWLQSYFQHRCSVLKIGSKLSKMNIQIRRGVPQGSPVLGPPVFSSYIHDFSAASSHTFVVKYADDLSLVVPLNSASSDYVRTTICAEASNASSWCEKNKLSLNTTKSKCLLVLRQPTTTDLNLNVEIAPSMKLLGVHLNNKLTWHAHVNHLRVACSRRLHILRSLRGMISRKQLHIVYEATIRSLMDYACPVFIGLNKKQQKVLNTISKRAHKIINYGLVDKLQCDACDLQERRLRLSVKLWRKIESNPCHLLQRLIPPKLEHSQKYRLSYFRTHKYGNSFFPFVSRFLNSSV